MFYNDSKVLIIAPHADDAEFGCGGTIKKLTKAGIPVKVLIMTFVKGDYRKINMITGEYVTYTGEDRLEELENSLANLGVIDYEIIFEDTTDNIKYHHMLDVVPQAVILSEVEKRVKDFQPTHIFVTTPSADQDHIKMSQVLRSTIRPQFYTGCLLEYEVNGEMNYQPNVYVRLTEDEAIAKVNSARMYETQDSGSSLYLYSPESIEKRMKIRGIECNSEFAEGFKLIKGVI